MHAIQPQAERPNSLLKGMYKNINHKFMYLKLIQLIKKEVKIEPHEICHNSIHNYSFRHLQCLHLESFRTYQTLVSIFEMKLRRNGMFAA